ncbi:MAG TPA: DUF6599 family protein [Candidatus Sulfotelmatobacter sp.]|nr:DUF6599 family protein [Candidatus Sulfotelmatobacter sp.]
MTLSARCIRTNSLPVFIVLIIMAVVVLGNAARAQSATATQPQLAKLLAEPLPGHPKPEGAPTSYKPDTLYQYIDGGADVYLLYDFQTLLHQDFKSGAAEVTVDIYDMGKSEDAFGIYSAERSPKYNYIPVGAEGYRSKGVLNFFQDRYYVKLVGSGTGADALLEQFAHTLSTRIAGSRTLPPVLSKLPQLHRVHHSEQYIRKDPLGHAFLAPAYVVTYTSTPKESKMFVSVATDPAAAKARLDQLAKHFKQTGECAPAPELGEGGIRAKNSFEGTVIARTRGRYVLLLVNPPPDGAALLKSAALALH